MEKSIGVEIIIVTGSTNGGAEGTRGCRDWRRWCGLENSEWQKISTPTMMTGKHSPFELKMPYLRLNTISAAFQEVADTPHLLSAMLNVVETRHRSLSGYWEGVGSWASPSSVWMSWQTPFVHLHVVDVTRSAIGRVNRTIKISSDEIEHQ